MKFYTDKLDKIAIENREIFKNAEPFSHLVIDNFLPLKDANTIAEKSPKPNQINRRVDSARANTDHVDPKLQCQDESQFPLFIKYLLHEFNSQSFLYFLKKLSGAKRI